MSYRIQLIIFSLFSFINLINASSPHGKDFKIDCSTCHQTENWTKIKENGFNHNKTNFPLTGQHKSLNCKKCHSTLVFTDTKAECNACHNDMHEGSVGKDCERCHTTSTWVVNNIREIHQNQGFPLLGAHATSDCNRCHISSTKLRFEKISSDCYACHKTEYYATSTPNHKEAGFDTDCSRCHNMNSYDWSGKGYNHNFFPLSGGHKIDCINCHKDGYKGLSSECVSCHLADYTATKNPAHATANFSKDCKLCHTINSWKPASFDHDSQYFPIYSGTHRGEWSNCNECHKNTNNYADFSCIDCHEHSKSKMDSEHRGERDYVYNSKNCLSCHPRGKAD
jgi:hypothetical protein